MKQVLNELQNIVKEVLKESSHNEGKPNTLQHNLRAVMSHCNNKFIIVRIFYIREINS